ncbi:MAG TPA: hypothetical protein VG755_10130 [Nannocystaceae bacterium]|nr:hypothetical protein [Nannocystaceae bacterium]
MLGHGRGTVIRSRALVRRCSTWLFAIAAAGCDRPPPAEPAAVVPTAAPVVAAPPEPAAVEPIVEIDPIVIVRDPERLAALDGLGFASVAFGSDATDNAALAGDPYYGSIVRAVAGELDRIARSDAKAGVGLRHVHRLFDVRWLSSERAWFELVAVVNRIDRRVFHPGTCGETRLVYRLAHRAKPKRGAEIRSRLPMTVNVVFFQPDDGAGCRDVAKSWRDEALREGPLAKAALALARLKSIEIDVQTQRWPSTIRPDLAGHAGYLLQVFARDEAKRAMVAQPLENTIDAERLRKPERDELLAWLREPATLDAIDRGTVVVPTKFLATRVESVTPRGLARRANRPFSQTFTPSDFADVSLSERTTIATPVALLRRLDELACNGCHQSRSIAGFHLLGDEPHDASRVDALAVGISPHLQHELVRREAYVRALVDGVTPDEARPLADASDGSWGARCGLGDPGFAAMKCSEGLVCTAIDEDELGTCLPAGDGRAGAPCEIGELKTNRDAKKDRITKKQLLACDAGVCDDNRVGFPAGMCVVGCGEVKAGEACGAIPQLDAFNNCLSTGTAFAECVRTSASPAGMRACDETNACRDDYICARTSEKGGVCMPPYFLYQLRVDGH